MTIRLRVCANISGWMAWRSEKRCERRPLPIAPPVLDRAVPAPIPPLDCWYRVTEPTLELGLVPYAGYKANRMFLLPASTNARTASV